MFVVRRMSSLSNAMCTTRCCLRSANFCGHVNCWFWSHWSKYKNYYKAHSIFSVSTLTVSEMFARAYAVRFFFLRQMLLMYITSLACLVNRCACTSFREREKNIITSNEKLKRKKKPRWEEVCAWSERTRAQYCRWEWSVNVCNL